MKRSLFVAAVLVSSVVACSSGESTGPEGVGTYALTRMNGVALPVTTQTGPLTQEILSGSLTLNSNGTFSETRSGRITLSGGTPSPISSVQSGTWAAQGSVVAFTAKNEQGQVTSVFSGNRAGEVITFTISGITFTYQMLEMG
jgi:hypothetical protein